jgi:hypothetical protein
LTEEEHHQLEASVRPTHSEARNRLRARIVLVPAAGTREISRRLRCTIGTAPKWRVRYARDRLAGLSKVGPNRHGASAVNLAFPASAEDRFVRPQLVVSQHRP